MRAILLTLWTLVAQTVVHAGEQSHRISLYWTQWGDTKLLQVPGKLLLSDMDYFEPQFVSLGYHYPLTPRVGGLKWLGARSQELEGHLVKHTKGQDHWEANLAWVLRSGDLLYASFAEINFAMGNGFSYALAKPTFEKGGDGLQGIDTRQFQYHMSFEFEGRLPQSSWAAVAMLHHRSGMYGVISPRRTGSNYLGFGLRYLW